MATAQLSSRLPGIERRSIYEGRFHDRNPDIRTAGKLTAPDDSAEACIILQNGRPESPEVVRRFRNTIRPEAGRTRIFYGKAYDPQLQRAASMTHGLCTQPSLVAGDLVNPNPNSLFKQCLVDKKESLYASHQRAPVGQSHDQGIGLPSGLDPMRFTFGVRTMKDGCAGELLNPNKSRIQVNQENELGHELYRKTHLDFEVGEQCDRNYMYPSFNRSAKFGTPTPHQNDGRHVRKTLKWLEDTRNEHSSNIVSKRVDDFRERTQPQLGKVHDPIKDTMHVSPDHTFGVLIKPDEYGVGDLMHGRNPDQYLRGRDRIRGVIAAMRQHLKKANYHNFTDLLAAFKHYDKDGSGKIDISELRSVCVQFHLPAEPELLEEIMDYCDTDRDGQINYSEFSNFLNWKDKMPSGLPEPRLVQSAPAAPERIQKQIDPAMMVGKNQTSSAAIGGTIGGATVGYRTYGVPTIRTDRPAPRIRRVSDWTNYGDQSDAYGLMNPSIYSSKGVGERDFFGVRSKEQLRTIFSNIGINLDYDAFDKIYSDAAGSHPQGLVSVETFRNVLDKHKADEVHRNRGIVY